MNTTPVVLITGSSRGIGKAISEKYTAEGWDVISPTRDDMDLAKAESIIEYFNRLDRPINSVINNAGINPINPIVDLNVDEIIETIDVNLLAPLLILKYSYRLLLKATDIRRVVNISSIWASVSKPGRSVYGMTKIALLGLTRTAAVEWAHDNILVNSVAPGYTNTELTKTNNTAEAIAEICTKIPLNRMAEPNEIAETVFFLGSGRNTYITGQTVLVDGGFTCI